MDKKIRKIIITIIITILVVIYLCHLAALIYVQSFGFAWFIAIIPAGLSVAMIHVCIQRIREIEGGEEDDLGEY